MAEKKVRRCPKDEVIFREGDEGDCAYLIEAGRVLIYLDDGENEVALRVVGQGEVFGEMSLIDASPRSASCRAATDCQLIVVSKQQLLDRINAADPVVRLLMQVLLERLRSQNDLIRGKTPRASVAGRPDPLEAEKKAALERIGLEHRIAGGLDDDEFVPFYQPMYDLETGELRGCEALIRWIGDDGTIVMPDVFMDVMEETYLILRGGQLMIEKSVRDLPGMLDHFAPDTRDFFVSINVSGRQFTDPGFIDHLETVRKKTGVAAENIKLELTERIMTEGTQALATLHDCRKLGYRLAIDDFGTGFSSLQYLAQMPLTDLKIDRSFIHKMQSDDKSLSVVKSLIYLSDLLKLKVIAEGVETKDQIERLRGMGVAQAQGYYFGRPIALKQFMQLQKSVTF